MNSPAEAIKLVSHAGIKKGNMRPDKVFLSAVSAGCLLNFGSAVMLIAITSPWYEENAPGLLKIVGALVFPFGFAAVIVTGVDLFTATTMFTAVPALQRRLPIWKMFRHWLLCFLGNLAGSLFITTIIFGYGGVFNDDPYREVAVAFVTKKQVTPKFYQIFLRGIGCNWLVCLACYFSIMAKDFTSKVVSVWGPVFGFVAIGFDHVIANMFFIPMGIFLHTPGLSVGLYIWKGMIPAALGNIIGGGLFCGCFYWWIYIFTEPSIDGGEKCDPEPGQEPVQENSSGYLHFKRGVKAVDEESRGQV